MASINTRLTHPQPQTHEGAPASRIGAEAELRRTLMACLLWEDTFYEDGEAVAARLARLTAEVPAPTVYALALEARGAMKLRHAPLLLAVGLARTPTSRHVVKGLLERIVQRPDELSEFLAIYWKDGRVPLAASVKKGLAAAFTKFSAYQLAKYQNG